MTNCGDDEQGSLRALVAQSADGDVIEIDATVCSTITLTSGQIEIPMNSLAIAGDSGIPTISAADESRIFRHSGQGTLGLYQVRISDGHYVPRAGSFPPGGGCIKSYGTVYARYTEVSHCVVDGQNGFAYGGAIHATNIRLRSSMVYSNSATGTVKGAGGGISAGAAYILDSVISGNTTSGGTLGAGGGLGANYGTTIVGSVIARNSAVSLSDDVDQFIFAFGGGVAAFDALSITSSLIEGNSVTAAAGVASGGGVFSYGGAQNPAIAFALNTSTVSGNSVSASIGTADGGGIYSRGSVTVYGSTIDHNVSTNNAAALLINRYGQGSAMIENSTISYNTAADSSAVFASVPLSLWNSTVADNRASASSAGVYLYPGGPADLRSSLIAGNTSSSGTSFDLVARDAVSGDHNLIQRPGVTVPADTLIGIDPLLGPLANNGGLTRTQALLHDSLAIDAGANAASVFANDQRGEGFPRQFGTAVDIGAFEWQGGADDPIFGNGFDP